jgi:hypothetical protein
VKSVGRKEAKLAKATVAQIACHIVSLVFIGTGIPAAAQDTVAPRDSRRIIDPIITEESLPEDAGECNLRMTAAYHAGGYEPVMALPRAQMFCGFSRGWGGEIELPMARVEGRYGPGDFGAAVKYKLRAQTSHVPALVLGVETTFPTQWRDSYKDTNEGGVEVQPFVAVLKQVHAIAIQGNVGLGISNSGSKREYRAAYNGAMAVPLRHTGFTFLGEVNAASSLPVGATLSFSPGLHHSMGKDRYMALALPVNRGHSPSRVGVVFQFQMCIRRERGSEE